ncbi:MAG TPA: L-2-hydroxyglutarate oxidase [Bdellovibrionales bacterium]|nr:MAG: hydroxyglutarate oxidase [Bdellovibrionales bacterium GWB1_52_6]OFZ05200.1 MAG: hydroxyglutarate oxidase [Bdellovibrionales bacterium GWA1_52_35]HAR44450.1 L-2-hydroxyglutarate oxidase [Bdellovibrionales bacterium]HCM38669.1 L-2-hydroxyglutarate oxidase [Bdellovibrionales bacterium]
MTYDYTIIGGGIVGLATAYELVRAQPGKKILVLEKEKSLAQHQTGRNSGVIHSGIYYKPGSFKAEFCKKGRASIVEFCREHQIPYDLCGKVIVATEKNEIPRLDALYERGLQHGLAVEKLTPEQVRAIEPHVQCLAGLRVPETGITDYRKISEKYAELIRAAGGEVILGTQVRKIQSVMAGFRYAIETDQERDPELSRDFSQPTYKTRVLINCAGLHSDRIARLAGLKPQARIVPFRGEYYELAKAKRGMVKNLIYPTPNPAFPFLGVHFTRMIDGSVHAGPNAVLALRREGYCWSEFSVRDLFDVFTFPGFWRLASRNLGEGTKEIMRSLRRPAFLQSLQRLIPSLTNVDIVRSQAGVRAQALKPDGSLVDDFLIEKAHFAIHVLNAPSPAATCSLEIGKWIAEQAVQSSHEHETNRR